MNASSSMSSNNAALTADAVTTDLSFVSDGADDDLAADAFDLAADAFNRPDPADVPTTFLGACNTRTRGEDDDDGAGGAAPSMEALATSCFNASAATPFVKPGTLAAPLNTRSKTPHMCSHSSWS